MVTDAWDPDQYHRFAAERRAPFDDLLGLVEPCPGGRVVDLGCGSGELTAVLHQHTGAASTVGIDSSAAMLREATAFAGGGLSFRQGDIAALADGEGDAAAFAEDDLDVVFANASLQWVPDHAALLGRLVQTLAAEGQLAFQVPANYDHPSHLIGMAVAAEEPFAQAFGGAPPADHTRTVLAPERYAELLDGLGATAQHVRLQVYGHRLESADDVVEWVKGTFLNPIRAALGADLFALYLERYRQRLTDALGPARPY
ncbi:MAG: methyltransferase domain-containing protein, partial [Acidimicrobiales bacterium]